MAANPKTPRLRDRAYLDSFKDEACWNCGVADDTVVGAHIRWGQEGGTGLKPPDSVVIPLCYQCHASQEANPGPEWWAVCLKNMARRRYEAWKNRDDLSF